MAQQEEPTTSLSHQQQQNTSQPQEQLTVVDPISTDETIYPTGIRLWIAVASRCTVSFLHGLDLTIVAATVPSLTNHFKRVADIGWYSSVYSLMTASCPRGNTKVTAPAAQETTLLFNLN